MKPMKAIIMFVILAICGCGYDMNLNIPPSNPYEITPAKFGTFTSVSVYRLDSTSATNIYVTVQKEDSILGITNVARNARTDSTFPWTINFLPPLTRTKDSTSYVVRLLDDHTLGLPDTVASWTIRLNDIEWWAYNVYLRASGISAVLFMRWS